MTTTDLSNWATLALVDKLAAVNDELIGRGQPARDIAAELGVDSIEELRAFAIADDRARDGVISPIECAPWCTEGDGHPDEIFHEDQTCFGPSTYLQVSKKMITCRTSTTRLVTINGSASWHIGSPAFNRASMSTSTESSSQPALIRYSMTRCT